MKVSDRLKEARERAGYQSVRDAVEAFGWVYSTYAGHENGSRAPKLDEITRYARAYRTSPAWLAFGVTESPAESTGEFIEVPRYDVRLSAGYGAFNDHPPAILDHIPFTRAFLAQKLKRSSVRGLMICEAKGDSMEPTIGDGDLVLIDQNHEGQEAGLYAVDLSGETMVKRLEKIDQGFSLISDNKFYPILHVRGSDLERLKIVGKVLWIGRTV